MSDLSGLLRDDAVALDVTVRDWREAIRVAGGLLEDTGSITSAYTDAMVDSVDANGPYIVVAPGFAFAHARPSEAVKETALSWVRLKHPIHFGHAKNDPVTLVVALAAQNDSAHTSAMKDLAKLLGNRAKRERLDTVTSASELRQVLDGSEKQAPVDKPAAETAAAHKAASASTGAAADPAAETSAPRDEETVPSKGKILTVCGNGLGTSLFLKNTLEDVLTQWGWAKYLTVEATDTISAKGRAKEADFLLTSGEIARTLGDVGVPVYVIDDFTDEIEIDRALRSLYAV